MGRAVASGRIDRGVEFVYRHVQGLPQGTTQNIVTAHQELIEQGVLAVLGPGISDNALASRTVADDAEVACLNWSGSEETRSQWSFQYQAGSLEDEPTMLASHLAELQCRRIAVVHDNAATGQRMISFFDRAAARLGLEIVFRRGVSALGGTPLDDVAADLLRTRPDAIVHLGMWALAPLATALKARDIDLPCLSNISASVAQVRTDWLPPLEGWIFTGVSSSVNSTAIGIVRALGYESLGTTRQVVGLDIARLAVEALANAPTLSTQGFREGLESIKAMSAIAGEDGTLLGFGIWDRAGLKGRYLVLQQYRNGVAELA
jgi:ABC-type branched-subunit amino acid transport system substrate-binding protein